MSATAPVVRAWSFRSDGGRESPEESREFAGRLAECFRSTPIDRGGVDWAWESGPRARLVLASGAPALASWIARSLVPEYRTAQWTPVAAPPEDVDGRVGRVLDPFPHPDGPFRSVGEGSRSWIDPVIRLLPMLPPGIRVVWRLEPLGMPDPRGRPPIDGPLSPQPPGWRSANPPRIRRDLVDLREDRRLAFQWRVRGEVRFSPPGPDGDADPPGLWETLAAASRREGGCGFRARPAGGWLSRRGGRVLLSSSEVAALFPLPWSRFVPPLGTRSIGSRPLLVGSGTTLAEAAIWMDPREGRHLVVLGETGMGKSTLIVRLARQAVPHSSVVLFDPLGGTALRFLAALPAAARSRLLWIDPVRSPVGINALASVRSESSASQGTERVVDELVGALRRVRESRYSENRFWGPRIDEVAHRALRTAALLPGGTLADAERLLSGVSRLSHGIPTEARPEVEELRTLAREQPDQVDGTRRLFAEISRNRVLTRMLCARSSTTSIGRIVEPRGVTIITGASGAVGESTARYLLSVLFALVWTELQARPAPSKTVLVLDEAQWYAHGAAAEILRLGRDRNVHLWLVTQALGSLPEEVQEAARTNAADFVLFRGSPTDAHEFHRWIPSVSESTLVSLPRGHALLLNGKGESTEWVSIGLGTSPDVREEGIRAAVEASRTYWAAEEPTPERAPPPAPEGGNDAGRPGNDPPNLDGLLRALWAGILDHGDAPALEVRLDALRSEFDPSGEIVREAGARLGRLGALTDGSGGRGRGVWVVRREPLEKLFSQGVTPEELSEARDRWRRIEARTMETRPQ